MLPLAVRWKNLWVNAVSLPQKQLPCWALPHFTHYLQCFLLPIFSVLILLYNFKFCNINSKNSITFLPEMFGKLEQFSLVCMRPHASLAVLLFCSGQSILPNCLKSDNCGLSFVSSLRIYGDPVDAFYRQWQNRTARIKSLLCQPFLRALSSRGMHPIIGTLSVPPRGDNDAPHPALGSQWLAKNLIYPLCPALPVEERGREIEWGETIKEKVEKGGSERTEAGFFIWALGSCRLCTPLML